MRILVLLFSLSLTLFEVNTFEYHDDGSAEYDDGRALKELYKELGGEIYIPGFLIPSDNVENVPLNDIPNETNVKPVDNCQETVSKVPEVTTAATENNAQQDNKKPYYDLKDAPELFSKFIKDFNKEYKDEEEYNKRYQNFIKNLEDINRLNKEEDSTFGINMFADLGEGESVIG